MKLRRAVLTGALLFLGLAACGADEAPPAGPKTEVAQRTDAPRPDRTERFRVETVEQAKAEAKAEADRIIAAAKAEVAQEVARAREQLREQVATLAVAGAEKILAREVDARAHSDLLDAIKREI